MSSKRDVRVLPKLRPAAVDGFLTALAPHFRLAAALDLRLRPGPDGGLVVLLPQDQATAEVAALHGRLAEAFEAAGRRASEIANLPLQTLNITDEPTLAEAVLALVCSHVVAATADGQDPDDAPPLRAVVDGAGTNRAAIAALVRRSRDARILVGRPAGVAGDDSVAILDLADDPARGATLAGLRAAGLPPGVTLLRRDTLAAMAFWLPEGRAFDIAARPLVSRLLNGLADADLLERGSDLHLLPTLDGGSAGRILLLPADSDQTAFQDAAALAAQIDGPDLPYETGPVLRFDLRHLQPDAAAQAALNARLNDRRFPLGYRIRLSPIKDHARSDADIERLRSEIEEREARIALILALGRPQQRLLRFTDAQLPALVDGLRRMPAALRDNRGMLYAAAHAAGRVEPAHYILYDPERVQFDGILPEFYWRAVAEDSPIRFWLDPHAEEARDARPDEPMVFVPDGERILPYIDSFGFSLSGTLQLVLGNLFADASAVIGVPGARPAFIFRGISGQRDEIAVELVDLARFAPLRASLRWINDHILASAPRSADPADLRELAETLYAGQLAQDMRASMRAEVDALKQDWRQAEAELLHRLDRLSDAVAREVELLHDRMADARRLVGAAGARLARIDLATTGLAQAMGGVDSGLAAMGSAIPDMAAARMAFLDQYEAEVAAGDQLIADTRREVEALRARMTALLQDLRR